MAEVFAATGLVLAAGISALASILVARLRTENTTQHDANLERLAHNGARLDWIASDLSEVKADVIYTKEAHDRHIEWHIKGKKPR